MIQTAFLKKFQNEIILALALILLGAGAGYNVTEESNTISLDSNYNVFEVRTQDVSGMMDIVLANPTEENLVNAQQNILYEYAPWANRQTGEKKEQFLDYLEACNQVIISLSETGEADTSKMESLKNDLI